MRSTILAIIACTLSTTTADSATIVEDTDFLDEAVLGVPVIRIEDPVTTIIGSLSTTCAFSGGELFLIPDCTAGDDRDLFTVLPNFGVSITDITVTITDFFSTITDIGTGIPLGRGEMTIEGAPYAFVSDIFFRGDSGILPFAAFDISASSGAFFDDDGTFFTGIGDISFSYEINVFLDTPSAAVPLPASIWILGSGLSLLVASSRVSSARRKRA